MATKFLNGIDLQGQKITGQADGSAANDGATKGQLDAAVLGLDWKPSARAATTTSITLSGTQTIDGVLLAAGDSVLVKNQTDRTTNGIYVVNSTAWARRSDASVNYEVTSGLTLTVTEGTTKGTGTTLTNPMSWTLITKDPIVIGTSNLDFAAVGGNGLTYVAGNGLNLTGATFNVVPGLGILADGTSTRIDTSKVAQKFSTNVGDGTSTSITVTHNLNNLDITFQLYEVSSGSTVQTDVARTTVNTVTLTFAMAPATSQYRCVIIG